MSQLNSEERRFAEAIVSRSGRTVVYYTGGGRTPHSVTMNEPEYARLRAIAHGHGVLVPELLGRVSETPHQQRHPR